MDPFRLWVAIAPLALYVLVLGAMNVSRRPWLVTGAQDLVALALAVTGLVIVGPMELLLPEAAAYRFGSYVWLLMLAFYGLSISFAALLARPKLIVYNMSSEELRPVLAELAPLLDPDSRWAGDNLALPNLGVQLHLDSFPALRNVSLCSSGERQNYGGWRKLEIALGRALGEVRGSFNPWGLGMISLAAIAVVACLVHTLVNPQALAQGFRDLLRM